MQETAPQPTARTDADSLSYLHRGGETPLLGGTLGRHLAGVVRRHGDREALVSVPQGRRLSYADLDMQTARLARGLLGLGVQAGDRVGVWSTDNVEWVLLQLATARVGAVLVNINPANRVGELEHALRQARVQTLFLIPTFRSSDYVQMVRELCPEVAAAHAGAWRAERLPELRHVVAYDPADPEGTERPSPGFLAWGDVLGAGADVGEADLAAREASLDPDDPINIQFTSGTTGVPKGVVLSHHNLLNNGHFIGLELGMTPEDRVSVPVPFYHCFGMVVSTLAAFAHGATLVIPAEHFDAGATLAAVAGERCTVLHGVPTMFIAQLEHPDFDALDLSSLRTGIMAGAPCPPELLRRVIHDMGMRDLRVGYGQTEASPLTHITQPGDDARHQTETVGTNLPHQETKVVDTETGRVLPRGAQGEVCFRGYHVMREYYGMEEATHRTVDAAGWLHSGDLGVMDDDGYLRITGRLKDMIKRGGECVYPAEIEAFYFEHPKVAQVAVFGVPDERMGEEIAAWVRLHEGQETDPEELRAWARDKISHFKVPRYVWIVDDFPTTVTGKVQKFRIQETVAGWMADAEQEAPPA